MDNDASLSGFPFKHKRLSKRLKSIKVVETTLTHASTLPMGTLPIYRCPLCKRSISCISTFILHVAAHSSSGSTDNFQQQLEDKVEDAATEAGLLNCDDINTDDIMSLLVPKFPRFNCDICRKTFRSKNLLAAHIKRHLSTKRFICETCGSRFKQKSGLREHFANVHNTSLRSACDICQKSFKSLRTLREHLEIYHLKNCKHKCGKCERSFGRKSDLKIHERQHDTYKEFNCAICGHGFTHRKRLKEHEKIHLSQKPHQCLLCAKSFAQLAGLNQHLKVHSQQPQFECEVCNARFRHSSTFYSHRKEHSGQKKSNRCEECGRECPSRFSLYHHKRTHLNLTYACSFCKKVFKWKESLRLHIAKHSTELQKSLIVGVA